MPSLSKKIDRFAQIEIGVHLGCVLGKCWLFGDSMCDYFKGRHVISIGYNKDQNCWYETHVGKTQGKFKR